MRYWFFILLTFSLSANAQFSPVKRALDNLQDGDANKARELLVKALERDSLDPGIKYAFSRLYDSPKYSESNPDSAYYYILEARKVFPQLDERAVERQRRTGIDSLILEKQKILLDSQAFVRARSQHTVDAYRDFQLKYSTARQLKEAVRLERQVAYQNAAKTDTPDSYKRFIENYPEALQVNDAMSRYEFLLFQDATRDGELESLMNFISDRPESPHREEVEGRLFEILTAGNRTRDFREFLRIAQSEKLRKRAIEILFHVLRDKGKLDEFEDAWYSDSLREISKVQEFSLYAVWESGGYNLVDGKGRTQFNSPKETMYPDYLCEPVADDYLVFENTVDKFVMSRQGQSIWNGSVDSLTNLGYGLIRISKAGKSGVLHKRGEQLLPFVYEDIAVLDGAFLKVKSNGLWGIITFSGKQITPNNYTQITTLNGSVIIEDQKKFAIASVNELRKAANGHEPNLVFLYDEFEPWPGEKIWVRSGDNEGIINFNSGFDMELGEQEIVLANGGYLVYGNTNRYLNNDFEEIVAGWSSIQLTESFGRATSKNSDLLLKPGIRFAKPHKSIALWGNHFCQLKNEGGEELLFASGKRIVIQDEDVIQLLKDKEEEYVMISSGDIQSVYNREGQEVLSGNFDNLKPLGKEYFQFSRNGKSGLYGADGTLLLDPEFDAFGNYNEGGVSVLKDGKLGYYNVRDSVWIPPTYSKRVVDPGNGWYIITTEDGTRIANNRGDMIEDVFSEVYPWNDSTLVVRNEKGYGIYDPGLMMFRLEGLLEFRLDKQTEAGIRIRTSEGYGLIHPQKGVLVEPVYSLLMPFGDLIRAVKYLKEADYYVMVYYNSEGEIVYRNGLTPQEYDKITCEQ